MKFKIKEQIFVEYTAKINFGGKTVSFRVHSKYITEEQLITELKTKLREIKYFEAENGLPEEIIFYGAGGDNNTLSVWFKSSIDIVSPNLLEDIKTDGYSSDLLEAVVDYVLESNND